MQSSVLWPRSSDRIIVGDLTENSAKYQAKLEQMIDDGSQYAQAKGFEVDAATVKARLQAMNWGQTASDIANGVIGFLSNTFLVLIFAIYLLQGLCGQDDHLSQPKQQKIEGRSDISPSRWRYLR